MPDPQRGTDRIGRRAKRFLSPSQKYEIWLQLVRQDTTISEAADRFAIDRSTIMRIREAARQGALEALATSKPGTQPTRARPGVEGHPGRGGPAWGGPQGAGHQAVAGGRKGALGLSGRIPPRVDAVTKAGLLALVEDAVDQGWTVRPACAALELGPRRTWRWLERAAADRLEDLRPGSGVVHRLLAEEVAEIVELFHQGGEMTASIASSPAVARIWPGSRYRRPACVGSLLPRVCGAATAGAAVTAIEDLVSRKWLGEVVSVEETSDQRPHPGRLLPGPGGRGTDGPGRRPPGRHRRPDRRRPPRPILLAMSDIHPEWRADGACGVRPAA
jgi:hypothetical protein